jgi:hypothetical protein
MNDHSETFDGEAVSRADREFLASLSNHPLARHSLYSVPPPPLPQYDANTPPHAVDKARQACFTAALDWLLVNYAYSKSAFMGKGGAISLVDGEMGSLASLKGFMQPYAIASEGPRGGLKTISVVDAWMSHPLRAHIDKIQTRSDRPRPTYVEDGLTIFNHYWPPAHPKVGGEIESFNAFFARLIRGARMAVELLRAQGTQALGSDGRSRPGGGAIRIWARDAIRDPRTPIW